MKRHHVARRWVRLLLLSAVAAQLNTCCRASGSAMTAVLIARDKKIASSSGTATSSTAATSVACLTACLMDDLCVAVNYHEHSKACEVMDGFQDLEAAVGWKCFRKAEQPPDNVLNPCASIPCQAGKVCVQYWPPAYVPHNPAAALNYSLPCFACSAHQWLLDRRDEGKTKCMYKGLVDVDFPGYDSGHTSGSFYDGFAMCSETDCLAMLTDFQGVNSFSSYTKATSHLVTGELTVKENHITWYPECF